MPSDSSRPDFWDTRFRSGVTPWDAGAAPSRLRDWIRSKPRLKVLVPGAGSGHEVRLLAGLGHDVLGIDFSDAAVEASRHLVTKADFFALQQGRFDLVYERAFLCALPRRLWSDWGRRMAELVRPGGELAGFFYIDDNQRGPPFGTSRGELETLLAPAFELASNHPIPAVESIPVFKGKEIWQVWRRRL